MESNNDKSKISLNRKMRLWNRYRNYVIGLVVIVVLVVIFAIVLKNCGHKKNNDNNKETTAPVTTQEHSSKEQETSSVQTTQAATEATTKAAVGRSLKLSGTAEVQDNTSSDHYKNAMFIGDFVISGISGFGFASDSQVIASNSMTSDKLSGYMDEFVSNSPDSVYIMVGINDLNYGTRSGTDVAERIENLVAALKENIPSAKIYVVSLLPVTESFEAKSSVKIKQSDINDANKKLAEDATTMGAVFVDIADSFKDGSGYLNTKYSTGGYNLNHNYYPFFLNKLAGAAK